MKKLCVAVMGNSLDSSFYRNLSRQDFPEGYAITFVMVTDQDVDREKIDNLKQLGFNVYIERNPNKRPLAQIWMDTFNIRDFDLLSIYDDSDTEVSHMLKNSESVLIDYVEYYEEEGKIASL